MNINTDIRVRFAPSPTGHLHIGSFRTALFNWLFARHNNGIFLVRIEDTDLERSKSEYVDSILDSLAWVDLKPDEPIVIQSEYLQQHKKVLQKLLDEKKAYRCFCSEDDHIKRQNKGVGKEDFFIKYDRYCRDRIEHPEDINKPHVIRFALPDNVEELSFDDLIRGHITIPIEQLDDFIIARSNGNPVYNFVVVVDDASMKISHVIRGEDHILNTFKQLLLYKACDYKVPKFAHLPLILGPSGDRLSKRDAATSVLEYRKMGYLPDALLNYLVRLGWSHGDQEIFTKKELINYFSLESVGKKGAIFDIEKLNWVNSVYIKNTDSLKLLDYITADVQKNIHTVVSSWKDETIVKVIDLYKERVKTLQELAQEIIIAYTGPSHFNENDLIKWITPDTTEYLEQLVQKVENIEEFTVDIVKDAIANLCKQLDIKLVVLAQPIRIAMIGKSSGPGVFALAALIGKQKLLKRIHVLLDFIKKK